MFDELKGRADAASAQLEGLQRQAEGADPEKRAELESGLIAARDAQAAARAELAAAGTRPEAATSADAGFSSAAPTPAAEAKKPEQREASEPSGVILREGYKGPRLNYLAHKQTYVETHIHPDLMEAKLANARTARNAEKVAAEKAERDAAAEAKDAKEAKDRARAARIFDGGHDRGLGTADYLKIEADHRTETEIYARNAEAVADARLEPQHDSETHADRAAGADQAEALAVVDLAEQMGAEYVVMEPGQEIEGEISAEVEIKGIAYFAVEFTDEKGQTKQALIPANGQDWKVGDEVSISVERSPGGKRYEIAPSRDYGM